jgi:hypothetical protein
MHQRNVSGPDAINPRNVGKSVDRPAKRAQKARIYQRIGGVDELERLHRRGRHRRSASRLHRDLAR